MSYRAKILGLAVVGLTAFLLLGHAVPGRVAAKEAHAPVPLTLFQFRSFMAPVAQPGAKPCLRAVTILVEVGSTETPAICTYMPRMRDAVLVELFSHPIVMAPNSALEVKPVEARLVNPLNRALGKDAVRRVFLIPGTDVVAEAAASRLPFSRVIGCPEFHRGRV